MKEFVIAHLLLQAAAATALMLVAGISSARQLHGRRPPRSYTIVPQETGTVVELPATRTARPAPNPELEAPSKAA